MEGQQLAVGSTKVKLTAKAMDKLQRARPDYPFVWDTELRGFGVRIGEEGTKTFILKYMVHGRQRIMSLGRYGEGLTADQARKDAESARGEVNRGQDPQAAKDAAKAEQVTVGEVWKLFASDRSKATFGRRKKWTPKTAEEYGKFYRNHIGPKLGTRPLASVTMTDVEQLRDAITDPKGKRKTKRANGQVVQHAGRYASADAAMRYLSGFFTWAIAKGHFTGQHPVKDAGKVYTYKPRERVLDDDEMSRFWTAVEAEKNLHAKAALKLYVFTACRREEVLGLRWTDVHLNVERPYFRLRNAKGGDRNVLLFPNAVEVLQTIPRIAGNPYVICGEIEGEHLVNITKPFHRALKAAEVEAATIHDLRRTFGSQCLKAGMDIYTLSKLLGHASVVITEKAYAWMPKEVLARAMDVAGERIVKSVEGVFNTVVAFKPRAA